MARRSGPRSARSSRARAIERELAAAGLVLDRFFTDDGELFGLAFVSPAP